MEQPQSRNSFTTASCQLPAFVSRRQPKTSGSSGAYELTRIGIAVAFLVAAALKLQWLLSAHDVYGSAPWSRAGELLLISAEWAVAVWLLTGFAKARARRATIAMLSAFVAVSAWHLFAGKADCGCFGNLHLHPAWSFSFDVIALAAIYWFAPRPVSFPTDRGASSMDIVATDAVRMVFAIAVSVLVPFAVLVVIRQLGVAGNTSRIVVVDCQSCIGKPFPLLEFTDDRSRADMMSGRRTVILLNRDCDKCRGYLARLSLASRSAPKQASIRIIDIAPPNAGESDGLSPVFRQVRLRPGVLYVANVPLELSLNGGIVEVARKAE